MRSAVLSLVLVAAACAHQRPTVVTISVVGTNDLHGHLTPNDAGRGGVAMLGGYLANLRAARAADGGGVLLIDGGDLFQGTLESNLNEGKAVVEAYDALGYDATAVGNHEFDFGPAGPKVAAGPGEDPRGALKARAAQASFPFLSANVVDAETGKTIFPPSTMKEVAGVKVGIVGVTTFFTPTSVARVVFQGLEMRPLAPAIDAEVKKLRAAGAQLIVVTAHAGLCNRVDSGDVVQDCDTGEIVDAVKALTEKVDVVIAGHTHAGVKLQLGDTAISEAWNYGRGFGRVDVVFDRAAGRVVKVDLKEPHLLVAGEYEGKPVVPDAKVAAVIAPYVEGAAELRARKLGVRATADITEAYDHESPLGNLFADLQRAVRPAADAGIGNGGGLRQKLPAGELTYGQFFEANPFDNFVATVRLKGAELRKMFEINLGRDRGILTVSGLRLKARCEGDKLVVTLLRDDGREIADDDDVVIVTSDYMAGGFEGARDSKAGVTIEEGVFLREEMIDALEKRGPVVDPSDPAIFDPAHPRLDYPGRRPVKCPVAAGAAPPS